MAKAIPRFRTQYDEIAPVREHLGSRLKQMYSPKYNDTGVLYLEPSGQHDLYGEIQSHRDSVDIHVLLARYRNGDESALERIQGAYGDFTSMPKTFAEALNTMIAAEQYFKSLPVDVRAKFGHDFNQFIATMDTPSWYSDVGLVPPGPPPGAEGSGGNTAEAKPDAVKTTPDTPAQPDPAPGSKSVETIPS